MYLIETNQLTKRYGKVNVVDKVDMHIPEKSIYGFVGENGSGKTTIMRLITGLAEPTSGSFSIFGISHKSKKIHEARNQMSAIVETASLVPTMTARDNIIYAEAYLGIKLSEEERNHYLELVGLANIEKKKVKNFSLGMRQRLAIAISLINKPKIMLLDEPMNGLDPEGIADLRNLLVTLNQEEGITILISSHILSELEKIATTYGFILKGKMLEEISLQGLIDKCQKSLSIRTDNNEEAEAIISSLGYERIEKYPNDELRVIADVDINQLVMALEKKKIKVLALRTNEEKVEDYYLNLLKEVR